MQAYTKHAILINNCYPVKEGEKGPKSSELSYLTFYASSRPAKLTKVGTFLEKKVERDIVKGRKQNNQVSLDIIKALIQSCHRDLNLFSKHVIDILDMIMDTRDLDLIDIACGTFVTFCTYHDGSTLSVDQDYTAKYARLLRKFAIFCQYENGDNSLKLNLRYIGHRGLQATVTGETLQPTDFNFQLPIILPPLLDSLSASKVPLTQLVHEGEGSIDIRQSALDKNLTEQDVLTLALQTLQHVFRALRGPSVRQALVPFFEYLDRYNAWWPSTFAVSVTEVMLRALQPQYRYIIVSELLQYLDNVPIVGEDENGNKKQACVVSMLHSTLNADLPLVGISVMEVMNTTFTYLVKVIKNKPDCQTIPSKADEDSNYSYAVYNGLIHSISGLAMHIYYSNQVNDIIGYLTTKLRAQTTLREVEGMPITRYRKTLLNCLTLVLEKSSSTNDDNATKSQVSLDVLSPALALLSDEDQATRAQFSNTLLVFIRRCGTWTGVQVPLRTPSTRTLVSPNSARENSETCFINSVHQAVVDWVQVPNLTPLDVISMYEVMQALSASFGANATIRGLSLIFKLQNLAQEDFAQDIPRQRPLSQVTVMWIDEICKLHNIEGLPNYSQKVKEAKIQDREWSPKLDEQAFRNGSELPQSLIGLIDDEKLALNAVVHWLDRHSIVSDMMKDNGLRSAGDTHGLELESKLYAEWNSINLLNEKSYRVQNGRDIDLKPRLATSLNVKLDADQNGHARSHVKVENLREALAQQLAVDSSDQENDSVNSVPMSNISKRPHEVRGDLNSLLNALSANSNAMR
ncbi:plasma membrane localization protein, variant 2 [Umbelopsis sp. WA50703]